MLEEFCDKLARELDITMAVDTDKKSANLGNVEFFYSNAYDYEIFAVRTNESDSVNQIELSLAKYQGKDEMTLRIGLPSLFYNHILERLDNRPLSTIFKSQFADRNLDQASVNSKFFEYTKIKNPDEIKDLIYQLFCIKAE